MRTRAAAIAPVAADALPPPGVGSAVLSFRMNASSERVETVNDPSLGAVALKRDRYGSYRRAKARPLQRSRACRTRSRQVFVHLSCDPIPEVSHSVDDACQLVNARRRHPGC